MSEPIITVENLSKRYVIGHQNAKRDGLRHSVENAFRAPMKFVRDWSLERKERREEFWALTNVTFSVNKGDVVGIIGRNGAGKSTLLKILSRITEPTKGRISLNGRVASLLEVGTGFHQELTGRENIFLNGAILGMSKSEIERKFDEIVAFSEIETFLDTPVKRYSSGMYVRLAFAVAAHLEPEILIVDEVLAVGDAAFQKKCLGKMGEVAKGGRTVLFVSHNMPAVQALCNKAVYLKKGTVQAVGPVESLLRQYHFETGQIVKSRFTESRKIGANLTLLSYEINPHTVESGGNLTYRIHLRANSKCTLSELSLIFNSSQGVRVAILDLRQLGLPAVLAPHQEWQASGKILSLPIVEGEYSAGLYINATGVLENILDLTSFSVTSRQGNNAFAPYDLSYRGLIELNHTASLVDGAVPA